MSRSHPTLIGRVMSVVGSKVVVELEPNLAGVSPTWNGRLHTVGQVGTTVSMPQGASTLLASVVSMSMHRPSTPDALEISDAVSNDVRSMEVQLLGEIDVLQEFHRGVSSYPSINDAVHFVSGDDLLPVYPKRDTLHLPIGELSSNEGIEVSLHLQRLVMRHSMVVGSTGAGKSSAVASILQGLCGGLWPSARIVVIDSHGEYAEALGSSGQHINLASAPSAVLPMWLLPAEGILRALLQGPTSAALSTKFNTLVGNARRNFGATAGWLLLDDDEINADSPVPFDIREVWYELDKANRRTCVDKEKTIDALSTEGDAASLKSASFVPYGPLSTEPYKGPDNGAFGSSPDLIRRALQDPRLSYLQPGNLEKARNADPLPAIVTHIAGETHPVSVIDTSGVSTEAAALSAGIILQLLFELSVRGGERELGPANPVLIVIEEAHRYFGNDPASQVARAYVNRIAREGRKYGIGIMMVSQRPSELPATAMSQVGTVIALRLNNEADQASVGSALPDSFAGLAQSLPSLRTGEAVVAGEAVPIPSRVKLAKPNPWPRSQDPDISAWSNSPRTPIEPSKSIGKWRTSS